MVSDPVAQAGGTQQVLPGKATEAEGVEALSLALKKVIVEVQPGACTGSGRFTHLGRRRCSRTG